MPAPLTQADAARTTAASFPFGARLEARPWTLRASRRSVAIAAVLAAMVLVVLDAAIANVALPTIARSLRVTPANSVWVITAYQTALVMALLPCAALGESLGYRRVFAAGAGLFTVASLLSALSPSLPWLIAARLLQGLGGAAVMALGVALLRLVVSPDELGAAVGWNALAVALSSAAGPTAGAAILSIASWPWLFAVNLPIGVFVLFAARALPNGKGTGNPLDLMSVTLTASAFSSFVIGGALLGREPMVAAAVLLAAAVLFVALVVREAPKEAPLIPLDLLRSSSFGISAMASVLCFAGVATSMVALPFHLQHGLHLTAWMTGLFMTPWPLMVAVTAPVAGRLANRVSTAWLCAAGALFIAAGLLSVALWPRTGQPLFLLGFTALSGVGFGLFNVTNNRNMFLSVPRQRSGAAGGLQGTARLTGQTTGAIIMTLLFTTTPVETAAPMGLWIGAVLNLAAALVSMLHANRAPTPSRE